MKNFLAVLALSLLSLSSYSQFHHNLEIGGSNYTGISFTTEYHFHLNPESPVYIAPKLGMGHIFWWDVAMTAQAGLGVGYKFNEKHWLEFNTNVSYLFTSPFQQFRKEDGYYYPGSYEAGNLLWYAGFDYKVKLGNIRYIFGAGVIAHLQQSFASPGNYMHSGDIIPMAKLGISF